MNLNKLKKAPRCHYLLVWDNGYISILNCCEMVARTDFVLALMTKDQYYEFHSNFQGNPNSLQKAMENIDAYWEHKRANNLGNEVLPCDFEKYEEYITAWEKEQENFSENFRQKFPNLSIKL